MTELSFETHNYLGGGKNITGSGNTTGKEREAENTSCIVTMNRSRALQYELVLSSERPYLMVDGVK